MSQEQKQVYENIDQEKNLGNMALSGQSVDLSSVIQTHASQKEKIIMPDKPSLTKVHNEPPSEGFGMYYGHDDSSQVNLINLGSTQQLGQTSLWKDIEFSDDEEETDEKEEKSAVNMSSMLRRSVTSVGNLGSQVTGSVTSFTKTMNQKLQNLFEDKNDDDLNNNLGSSSDYKAKYLNQYGVSFTIPSLYVQASTWYPVDPSYFIQIVNYVVPSRDEYEVNTHFMEVGKDVVVNRFEDIFQEKIQGCTLRLIQTQKELSSIKLIDSYTFADTPRIDKLEFRFSIGGKYFAIFSKENNFFRVYAPENIEKIFDEIRKNKSIFEVKNNENIEDITFGNNQKYLIVKYTSKLEIYRIKNMCAEQSLYKPDTYVLPPDTLENICDYCFYSDENSDMYKCYIACKVYGQKKIKILEIKDLANKEVISQESNTINYFEELSDNFIIKIKEFQGSINTVFVNGSEQFMVEISKNGEINQMQLTQIGSRKIKFVYMDKYTLTNSNCYLFACNDYDQDLYVFKANDIDFQLKIKRDIQPNIIKIFDFIETQQGELKSLSNKDDEFIIDQAYETSGKEETIHKESGGQHEKATDTTNQFDKKSYIFSSVRAFSINWPYVAFTGLENFIMVVNQFNKKQLHRIQYAPLGENAQVYQTFISNTKDLFVVIKTQEVFKVLMLDFDEINSNEKEVDEECFKFQQILEYSAEEVGNKSLTSLFARGSSRKEVIQLNQKLVIFFQHEDQLFGWVQGSEICCGRVLSPFDQNNDKVIISQTLQIRDDNCFYYCWRSLGVEDSISEILQVTIGYSDYSLGTIAKENSSQYDYIGSQIDRIQEMVLIFMKENGNDKSENLFLKIIDLNDLENIILECEITDFEMKGIFLSGQYKLVDGHIYFQNKVIKLRYDLMKKYGGIGTNQEIYFNKYCDILVLKNGETIKIDSPLDSMQAHRFAFIMLNNEQLACKRLMIIPYLHERKVYLNRMKKNTSYFYTSKQINISQDKENPAWIPYIFAFNLNESKFYVYSEKGLLINRIEYAHYTKKYGEIVSTSPDGQSFALHNKSKDTITIIRFYEEKVCYLKAMNVQKAINQFVKLQKMHHDSGLSEFLQDDGKQDELADDLKNNIHWVLSKERKQLKYVIKLNNKADILMQISKKDETDTIYFFNANFKIDIETQEEQMDQDFKLQCKKDKNNYKSFQDDFVNLNGQNLMILRKMKKFTMTHEKIFMWDNHNIEYYDFRKKFIKINKLVLRFQISPTEKFAYIEKVSAVDNTETIAIVVQQIQKAQVFCWNLEQDNESKEFEVDKEHEIIWDQQGMFMIFNGSETTMPIQNCNLKCFIQEEFEKRNQSVYCDGLNYEQGYRFDFANHNWIIMKNYIQMSFSYMTFVIQGTIEEIEVKADSQLEPLMDKAFDLEAFTFMLNKNSCFTSGNLMKDNFLKLQQVLKKLLECDPVYLEILHYTITQKVEKEEEEAGVFQLIGNLKKTMVGEEKSQEIIKSALHESYRDGNNRVVDIIMSYMAKIEINNSEIFKDILCETTDLTSFGMYLENLETQTTQMLDKKLLRIKEPFSESIVAMAPSHTAYVDDIFFREKFGEDKENQNYKVHPVEILSLKIGWITNTPEGKEFLEAILQGERLDYFEIKSLQIIIEFLYQKSKALLLNYLLPLYMLQGVCFVLAIIFQELRYQSHLGVKYLVPHEVIHVTCLVVIVLNQVQTLIMVFIMAKIFMFSGRSFFQRVYTWFDIIFYTFNTMASQLSLTQGFESQEQIRILQAFGILLFLAKNFYFMKLVDEIAPLIDIIIQVFFDIKWFMFIFFLFIGCFGFSFYLIGRNQMDYDNIDPEEQKLIPYGSLLTSFYYMWNVCLGGGGTASFELGDGTQFTYLSGFFVAAQFIMLIHLLNMLVAIMGDTFGKRNEVAEQVKTKDHLAFVIDNWYLKDFSLGDPKQINYIITAFHVHDDGENNEVLEKLQEKVGEIKEQISTVHTEITKRQYKQAKNMKRQETSQRIFESDMKKQVEEIQKNGIENKQMLEKVLNLLQQ